MAAFPTLRTLLGGMKAYDPDGPYAPGAISSGAGGYCLNPDPTTPAQDPWRASGDGTCGGNPARRAMHESICASGAPAGTGICGPCDHRVYPEAPVCANGQRCACETANHEAGQSTTGWDCQVPYAVSYKQAATWINGRCEGPPSPEFRRVGGRSGEFYGPIEPIPVYSFKDKAAPWYNDPGTLKTGSGSSALRADITTRSTSREWLRSSIATLRRGGAFRGLEGNCSILRRWRRTSSIRRNTFSA